MSIQSVSNVSFGATTKNGNDYKKTHAATIAGTAVGGATGFSLAYTGAKTLKTVAGKKEYILGMKNMLKNMPTLFKGKNAKIIKGSIAAVTVASALVGLGIGAGTNKIINHNKAAKADKAAAKAE